jgi:hypothetical protein
MKYFLFFAIIFTGILNTACAQSLNETIRISGNAKKGDTVKIYLWDHYFGQRYDATLQRRIKQQVCDDGNYSFEFDAIKGPVYFSMSVRPMGEDHVIENYLAFPWGQCAHNPMKITAMSYFQVKVQKRWHAVSAWTVYTRWLSTLTK